MKRTVSKDAFAELQCFAQGIERDRTAVKAALDLPWSPVEPASHQRDLVASQVTELILEHVALARSNGVDAYRRNRATPLAARMT